VNDNFFSAEHVEVFMEQLYEGLGRFFFPSLSFPRRRESQIVYFMFGSPPTRGQGLDARLRGHDRKNSTTFELSIKVAFVFLCLFLMNTVAGHKVIAEDHPDFLSVTGPCNLVFPKDHGPHPGYRTEWWYYTGNLLAESGDRYGYQLTFFRSQISASGTQKKWPQPASAWRTQQVYLAHAAISDISAKRHLQAELVTRGALGMAGASNKSGQTTIFIKNWSAQINPSRHILKAVTDDFSYDLTLQPVKPPVLHGQSGYSRKGSTPERASCYYSLARLIAKGSLKIDGKEVAVEGLSWMDHEYSTAPLEPGIVGWDWFSLQLSDQTEIMLFLLRQENGGINPTSSGTFVDRSGKAQHLTKENFSVEVLDHWKSPKSGAVYPAGWRLNVFPLAIELTIVANLSDQEMQTAASTGVTYWEGSVSAHGKVAKQPIKAGGYIELTGYAQSFSAPL
jgi:predicted secreted hydrolase